MNCADFVDNIQKPEVLNYVGGKDKFMSGWGKAKGCISYAFWACTDEQLDQVTKWIKSRSEFSLVMICSWEELEKFMAYNDDDKFSIYHVGDNHPSLKGDDNE